MKSGHAARTWEHGGGAHYIRCVVRRLTDADSVAGQQSDNPIPGQTEMTDLFVVCDKHRYASTVARHERRIRIHVYDGHVDRMPSDGVTQLIDQHVAEMATATAEDNERLDHIGVVVA